MEKNDKNPKGYNEILDFIEDTKEGKFTEKDFSITGLLKCSISHEEVEYIQNVNVPTCEIVLYGLN